jgi:hypothetical protein
MKKDYFLRCIQQAACFSGSDASIVWPVAVNADEKDPRWHHVEDGSEVINFASAWGIILPGRSIKPVISKTAELKSQLAYDQKKLAEFAAADHLEESVKAKHMASIRERIARIEKQIADEE